jgi:hypothetical protein
VRRLEGRIGRVSVVSSRSSRRGHASGIGAARYPLLLTTVSRVPLAMRDQPVNSAGEVFTSVRQLPPSSRASSAALTRGRSTHAKSALVGSGRICKRATALPSMIPGRLRWLSLPAKALVGALAGGRFVIHFLAPRLCSAPVIETSPVATRRSTVAVLIGRLSFAAPQRKQGRPSTLRRGIAGRGGAPGGLVRAADPGMNACREVSSYSATLMCVTALLTILRCV